MRKWTLAIAVTLSIGASGLCHAGAYSNDFSSSVGAASLRGSAVLDAGSVRLTENVGNQEGSLVIDNLDGDNIVHTFDASFTIAIGPSGVPPADGVSFSFGPPPAGTYGESGAPSGIVVIFDTFDNLESPTPPVIRVLVDGVQVAAQQVALESGGAFRPVTVHFDANGLDVDYNSGAVTFTNLAPGFVPNPFYQFTFGGRTGGSMSEQRIDDVSITTAASRVVGVPVPTLGEWAMIVMAGLLACLGGYVLRRRRKMRSAF